MTTLTSPDIRLNLPSPSHRPGSTPSAPCCGSTRTPSPPCRGIYLGMVAALLAGLVALAIPQVLQQLVDGPLADGRRRARSGRPCCIVLGLGVARGVLIALRRWFVLGPGTHVEARMRNALYARLQDLPVTFHDRWPSGQLLSRAVSDLSLIRRWLSFGLVLLVVNLLTIVVGVGILISMNWLLGAHLPGLLDPALDLRLPSSRRSTR